MNRQHDIARIIVDIDKNVGDQGPQQLLARAHRDVWGMPSRRQIFRQRAERIRLDLDI